MEFYYVLSNIFQNYLFYSFAIFYHGETPCDVEKIAPSSHKFSGGNAEENRVGDDGLVQDLYQSTRQFGGRREDQGIKASLAWAEAASQCPWLLKQAPSGNLT